MSATTTDAARSLAAAAQEVARAVAAYDEVEVSEPVLAISETLADDEERILRAIGLISCAIEDGEEEPLQHALRVLTDARKSIRVCVRGGLEKAGVFVADKAVRQ